jgi:hypothetical protein
MDFKKIFEDFKNEIKNMLPAPVVPAQTPAPVAKYTVGQPAPDLKEGENPQPDGSVVVVSNGLVTEIKPAQAAPVEDKYVTVAQFQEFATMVKDSLSAVVKPVAELKASVDTELVNIKNQIKGKHTPPTKQFAKQPESELTVKDIMALKSDGKINEFKIEYKRKFGVEPEL